MAPTGDRTGWATATETVATQTVSLDHEYTCETCGTGFATKNELHVHTISDH